MSKPSPTTAYLVAAALGGVAGMRSLLAPALVSHHLARQKQRARGRAERWMGSSQGAATLKVLSAGELVMDKVPGVPDRIEPPLLLGRALSGALAGAAVATRARQPGLAGAAIGAVAAVASAYAMYHLRQQVGHGLGVPDAAVALAEDGLALGVGMGALRAL